MVYNRKWSKALHVEAGLAFSNSKVYEKQHHADNLAGQLRIVDDVGND